MSEQLKRVYCPVRATVGNTKLSINDFIHLQLGDLLILDTRPNQENTVFVREKPTFKGLIGRQEKYRAVMITDIIEKDVTNAV